MANATIIERSRLSPHGVDSSGAIARLWITLGSVTRLCNFRPRYLVIRGRLGVNASGWRR